jgi:hypothetical protein
MKQRNNILQELQELNSSLGEIQAGMAYSVPAGYFENLAELVLLKIKEAEVPPAKEIETLSPLLSRASRKMPFEVPGGYFEQPVQRPQAKVVSITRIKWFRIAAAAIVTSAILLAGWLYFGPGANERKANRVFVKLSRDINKMTETQKDNMIDYIDAGLDGNETAQGVNRVTEVKELLKDVSEEELKLFQEQSEDIEEVLMTN